MSSAKASFGSNPLSLPWHVYKHNEKPCYKKYRNRLDLCHVNMGAKHRFDRLQHDLRPVEAFVAHGNHQIRLLQADRDSLYQKRPELWNTRNQGGLEEKRTACFHELSHYVDERRGILQVLCIRETWKREEYIELIGRPK